MMAAPRFWTQGIMTSLYQASSLMTSMAGWPLTCRGEGDEMNGLGFRVQGSGPRVG